MYPIEKYTFFTYDKNNDKGRNVKTTVAISSFGGKVVKGVAKCMPDDEFDAEVGKKLAAARCDLKVCNKRVKRAYEKLEMAQEILKGAQEHFYRMKKYHLDAINEACESEKRLFEIEKELN